MAPSSVRLSLLKAVRALAGILWAQFRTPRTAVLLADFSRSIDRDNDPKHIARCLEVTLRRALGRTVAVVTATECAARELASEARGDGAWRMDRRAIAADLHLMRLDEDSEGAARFSQEFGVNAQRGAGKIAAVVPILSASGSRVATVVIGRKWVMRLSERERSLTAALVGMAALLLEQSRLRQQLRTAEVQAEAVGRLVQGGRVPKLTSQN